MGAIAKRIEEGVRELMHALAFWPGAVEKILHEYDLVNQEERRLADVISGWLDPTEDVPPAEIVSPQPEANKNDDENEEEDDSDSDDDDEEGISGVDPEEAKE